MVDDKYIIDDIWRCRDWLASVRSTMRFMTF
jgi:hypothetical protein